MTEAAKKVAEAATETVASSLTKKTVAVAGFAAGNALLVAAAGVATIVLVNVGAQLITNGKHAVLTKGQVWNTSVVRPPIVK